MSDWAKEMAAMHAASWQDGATEEVIEKLLNAAGELKACRLKVLLGRCYEIITIAKECDTTPLIDEGFAEELLKEFQ